MRNAGASPIASRDRVGADPVAVERVVGEAPAEHPLAGRAARALGGERAADLVERAQALRGRRRACRPCRGTDGCGCRRGRGRAPSPRRPSISVPAPHVLAHLGVVADRDDRPSRTASAVACGRSGRACGSGRRGSLGRRRHQARQTIAALTLLAAAAQHPEVDRAAAVRAGRRRRAVEVAGIGQIGIDLEVGARAPPVLEVVAALGHSTVIGSPAAHRPRQRMLRRSPASRSM